MKKIIFMVVVLFFSINYVSAVSCDNDDIARLKVLAQNVNYSSDFIGDKDGVNDFQLYNVSFSGLNDEMYISDVKRSFFVYNDNDVIKMRSGINNLEIYSKNCGNRVLRTLTINLPIFNVYSLSEECDSIDINEFELCDPWYQGKIDSDYFSDNLNKYLKSKEKKKEENKNKSNWFIDNIYLLFVLGIIVIIVLIIVIKDIIKKNKLD